MSALDFTPPAPITANHELAAFDSGEPSLNEWLKKRAFKNHASGASRCFVLCTGADVIAYYSLSAGAISHEAAPKTMQRTCPTRCRFCCWVGSPSISATTIQAVLPFTRFLGIAFAADDSVYDDRNNSIDFG